MARGPNTMFKLMKSESIPLTLELAKEFCGMEASPTERELSEKRVQHLREKAGAGTLVNFHWARAYLGDKVLRMNGKHSSTMLTSLNGGFPEGLVVHLDDYKVDGAEDLAVLFRQFDDRASGRTPADIAGAFQGLHPELAGVAKSAAKLVKNILGCKACDSTFAGLRDLDFALSVLKILNTDIDNLTCNFYGFVFVEFDMLCLWDFALGRGGNQLCMTAFCHISQ